MKRRSEHRPDRLPAFNPAAALPAKLQQANTFHQRGQLATAQALYEDILRVQPRHFDALHLLGVIAAQTKNPAKAANLIGKAIEIDARHAEAHFNRGNVLKQLEQWNAALAGYDRAIAIKPDFSEAHFNRGFVLKELGQVDAALASYNRGIAIQPGFAEGHHNRAIAWLLGGNFEAGWVEYEWRWKSKRGPHTPEKRPFPQPLWLGKESLAGKTILLHSEQGLGDTLQFCRYAKRVAGLGAKVILEVQPPLLTLLAGLEGVSQLVGRGDALPGSDYQCPLLSLPLAFNTALHDIPSAARYLQSDPAKIAHWHTVLGEKRRPRIGLIWSGNPAHTNDHNRSIPLANLMDHLPAECQYIGLQKELREADVGCLNANPAIVNFAEDFSDTAALCECMDLVISVDTSVAHLSAALGLKTWILLPFNPDWRWLLDRNDSPWYPSVTLYRQQQSGDWSGVLKQVAADLRQHRLPMSQKLLIS